ncbi:MAG TPA: response regulator, partial [Dehalococcoidia bacterium]|nr:response regulator [Dehalococcoidia bacterium]
MTASSTRRRVLVVEDDETLRESLRYTLSRDGYEVVAAADGPAGLRVAREDEPDLVILDLMLPGLDGLEVCRQIRRSSQVPILMLTAKREEVDRVVGLEIGADDYVAKPFSMRELLARVRALLRRSVYGAQQATEKPTVVRSGDMTIDLGRRETRIGERV